MISMSEVGQRILILNRTIISTRDDIEIHRQYNAITATRNGQTFRNLEYISSESYSNIMIYTWAIHECNKKVWHQQWHTSIQIMTEWTKGQPFEQSL